MTVSEGRSDHVAMNRRHWDEEAATWHGPLARGYWSRPEPCWGLWSTPESEPKAVPHNVAAMDVVGLEAVLDRISADRAHVRIGDPIRVVAVPGTFVARVTGIADFKTASEGNTRVYFDTATAQRLLLGKPGAATSIRVDAAFGVTPADLSRSIAAVLGGAVQVQAEDPSAVSRNNGVGQTTDFLGMVMMGFAVVAVLVGVLLIFNTFSMLVGARTRELGLLRAIGASRRQVNRSVRLEALLLGLLGSTLGVGAGIGLAVGLHAAMGSFGLDLGLTSLVVGPDAVLAGYAVGTVATVSPG